MVSTGGNTAVRRLSFHILGIRIMFYFGLLARVVSIAIMYDTVGYLPLEMVT